MRDDLKFAAWSLLNAAEALLDVKFKYAGAAKFIETAERVKAEQFVQERVDALRAAMKPSNDLPERWTWKQGELAMAAERRVADEAFTCFVFEDNLVFDMVGPVKYTGLVPLDVVYAVIERAQGEVMITTASEQLICKTHGEQTWNGQVICAEEVGGCGRVWHLGDANHALHPPAELGTDCVCGKSLGEDGGTAMAVCPQCFEGVRAARGSKCS